MAGKELTTGVSRRSVLMGGAAFGIVAAGGGIWSADAWAIGDRFTVLRDRWIGITTGAPDIDTTRPEIVNAIKALDTRVTNMRANIDRTANRTNVFTGLNLGQEIDSAPVSETYTKLHMMATAWATPGSIHHQSGPVLTDVLKGLATANKVYAANGKYFDNWWDWEVGSAIRLASTLALLDTQISAAARQRYVDAIRYYVPDPKRIRGLNMESTGANRAWLCQAVLLEGIAGRSDTRIALAVDGLPETCRYVTDGDGFWIDGSYLQHRDDPYTGAYGTSLLAVLANLKALLAGSAWPLDLPNLPTLVDAAYAPVIHDGRMMSFVRGRAISHADESEQDIALTAIAAMLRLARTDVADAATRERWRARCRGWLERAWAKGNNSPCAGRSVTHTGLVSQLLHSTTAPLAEPGNSVIYRNMARAVHRRNGWAFSISMASNRISRYERSSAGENAKGWYTGSGMTYLYDDDNNQFSDEFWPTVDPYRLPGTTIDLTTMDTSWSGHKQPTNTWAGGAVLDDRYSNVGLDLTAAVTDLTAKKSWFCFDEFVFCMGSAIKGGAGSRVRTVVENRNLHVAGTDHLLVNGTEWTGTSNWLADTWWAHLQSAGQAPGITTGTGYVFPGAVKPTVLATRATRTGSWREINPKGSSVQISRPYLTLEMPHGMNPTDGHYAYLVVPKATPARTAALATAPGVTIMAQNASAHAVRQPGTGLTMINFWNAPYTVGGVGANRGCSVIVQERNNVLKIAVASPLRNKDVVRVTIAPALSGYRHIRSDSTVTVVSAAGPIVLDVATKGFGKTHTVEFGRTI